MSDCYLKFIPTDHLFVPSDAAMEIASGVVAELCPHADEVTISKAGAVMFYDCGGNLESITCAHCGASQFDWFFEETSRKHVATALRDLRVQMPCCSTASSLNELRFEFPAGFASAGVEVLNPGRDWLTAPELAQLAAAFGHPIRQVMAHY